MTNTTKTRTAPTNATFLAHTAHAGRNQPDDSCLICDDQGAARLSWTAFVVKYPKWNRR